MKTKAKITWGWELPARIGDQIGTITYVPTKKEIERTIKHALKRPKTR